MIPKHHLVLTLCAVYGILLKGKSVLELLPGKDLGVCVCIANLQSEFYTDSVSFQIFLEIISDHLQIVLIN